MKSKISLGRNESWDNGATKPAPGKSFQDALDKFSENKSSQQIEFDEAAARQESYRIDNEASKVMSDDYLDNHSFILGARWQFIRDKLAYETKLVSAEALIGQIDSALKRRNDAYQATDITNRIAAALNLIKAWRSK